MTSRSAENVTTGAAALEIQDVVAGYGGGDVLHGVTMQVYEGGITCVVGPNGAGKSTLLGTISGLLNPRLGQVSLGIHRQPPLDGPAEYPPGNAAGAAPPGRADGHPEGLPRSSSATLADSGHRSACAGRPTQYVINAPVMY